MLWRHFRLEDTHCELFAMARTLLAATRDFFDRYNQRPTPSSLSLARMP